MAMKTKTARQSHLASSPASRETTVFWICSSVEAITEGRLPVRQTGVGVNLRGARSRTAQEVGGTVAAGGWASPFSHSPERHLGLRVEGGRGLDADYDAKPQITNTFATIIFEVPVPGRRSSESRIPRAVRAAASFSTNFRPWRPEQTPLPWPPGALVACFRGRRGRLR